MKKLIKRVIPFVMAFVVTISFCTLISSAAEYESEKTIRVGDYDCIEIDGQYYTVIDGVEYIVLSFTEKNKVKDKNLIAELESRSMSKATFDLSTGATYSGTANLSSGNSWTPTFILGPKQSALSMLSIKKNFIFPTTVKMTAYFYVPLTGWWHEVTVSVTFTLLGQTRHFLADTYTANATKGEIEFWKNGTDPTTFDYYAYQ